MLVLASGSPRRRKLLALGGWEFLVLPVEIDESPSPGERPRDYVTRIARQKVTMATSQSPMGTVVLAADTAVVAGDQILGKPINSEDAVNTLKRLRGGPHQVYTALAIMREDDQILFTDVCITNVFMRHYSDLELLTYVESGDPMDKAGAYAIQHHSFDPVERLDGCYTNVVGLPLCYLYRMLRKLDGPIPKDVSPLCQASPTEPCQINPGLVADL